MSLLLQLPPPPPPNSQTEQNLTLPETWIISSRKRPLNSPVVVSVAKRVKSMTRTTPGGGGDSEESAEEIVNAALILATATVCLEMRETLVTTPLLTVCRQSASFLTTTTTPTSTPENNSSDTDPKKDAKNSELFTLTYGSLISQLIKDTDSNTDEVNKQLERIGYNIGMRIIEDFLARTGYGRCNDLRDTAEKIQTALRLYTPLTPSLTQITSDEFTLLFEGHHPFAEFAELPDTLLNLKYANILPGIIRGACEMVQMEVMAWIEKDTLKGDGATEVKVRFIKKLVDALPSGED